MNKNLYVCNNSKNVDVIWMQYAIKLASCADIFGEIPIGSVLVLNDKIIGYGWNSSIILNDPSAHAEIIALRMGGKFLSNYRLLGSTLYVTLEPCMMCIGAIVNARIFRLVYGAKDRKIGWTKKLNTMLHESVINHKVLLTIGVLEQECSEQLDEFFKRKR